MIKKIRKKSINASWKKNNAVKPFLPALRQLEGREKRVKMRWPTTFRLRKRHGSQILKGWSRIT